MNLNFLEAYNQYLVYIENRLKIQSKEDLKVKFENKIIPFFKDYNIYDIKELDFINWKNEIEKNNYSNNYKEHLFYCISGFLNYCVMYHNLEYNVAKKVGNFKMKNEKVKHDFYTLKEFKKFIKYVDNNIYKQFFIFMFFTGTRPGEAMALKFSDLNNRIISINKTISEHSINGKRIIDTPKNMSSVREIFIDKKLNKELLKLKKIYEKEYDIKNHDYFIFGGLKPLAPTSINRHKKKACEKANLRQITIHQFRHSHASLLYSKKIDIQSIKERLGHSSINTTMSVYVHLDNKQKKKVQRTLSFSRLLF